MTRKTHLLRSPPRLSLRRTFKYASLGLVGRLASETFLVIVFLLVLISSPASARAFSDGFKKQMTTLQERVMLEERKFTARDAAVCWQKFDEEILSILSERKPSLDRLNRSTARTELSVYDPREEELIELGTIEARFYRLWGSHGKVWLVTFSNVMGDLLSSTFHIYKAVQGGYERIAALEDFKGPWNPEKTIWAEIQIQPIVEKPGGWMEQFASYHSSTFKKSRNNRAQIVWKFDGSHLQPDLWIPEVDWHEVGGERVAGRGEAIPVFP